MRFFRRSRLKYILWVMALGLAGLYIHCMIYFPMDPFRFNPILITKIFFIAIFCNLGLVLITLDIAKIYKRLSTLLFIPSVTITPVIAGLYFIPAFFVMLIINAYFFIRLNPWKKDEMEPTFS